MATFNILSSCICRDAFGFQENCSHEVITFLQSTSPITWFEFNEKPKKPLTLECFNSATSLSEFKKKCIISDYNKTVLNSYTKKTDFFILDFVHFVNSNIALNVDEQGNKNYFTFSKWFQEAYGEGLEKFFYGKLQLLDALELLGNERLMKKTVDSLVDWLVRQKQYKDTQIILVRNKRAECYSDLEYLYFFDKQDRRLRVNLMLDKIYDYFEDKMPKCHVLRMPYGIYADTHHKWGLTDLHVCKGYYDYLYCCFDLITKGREKDVNRLFFTYSDMFEKEKNELLLNSIQSFEGKQLLTDNLHGEVNEYIVCQGAKYYSQNGKMELKEEGVLKQYIPVYEWNRINVKIVLNNEKYLVKSDDCIKGYAGNNLRVGQSFWKTQNKSTLVKIKENSIIIGHNGSKSIAQAQIIRVVDNNESLQGKVVTLSVYARVLQQDSEGRGGTIAFINANDYNAGCFFAKTDFVNTEWKKVYVSTRIPEGDDFKGLTICLRALVGSGNDPRHAIVEYYMPKLEIGSIPTK